MTDADILAALDAQLDPDEGTRCSDCSDPATTRIAHRCGRGAALMCRIHAIVWWAILPLLAMDQRTARLVCRGCEQRLEFTPGHWTQEELP